MTKAKRQNHMRVTFDSKSVNENFARTAAAGFLAALDPTLAELTDVKTAVSVRRLILNLTCAMFFLPFGA